MATDQDLARMRLEYETAGLAEADVAPDPFQQFDRWLADAVSAEVYEPNAMVVSTVDADGQPWSRHLLLKGFGPAGFDFFTNYESRKSVDLATNLRAAATFGWLPLHRQVNIAGSVVRVPEEESDTYWAVRTRGAQLGAWASAQSRPLADRQELLDQYRQFEDHYQGDVPRPAHWGGWRIVPHTVEFWQGRENRLHDRLRYVSASSGSGSGSGSDFDSEAEPGSWQLLRLSP